MTHRVGISYAEDQKFVTDGICRIAKEEGVDGILIAGDIFDKSISSQEAIRLCDGIITRICAEMKIPVYMIAGNHDGAERISQYNGLLRDCGLYIEGSLSEEVRVAGCGDVDIYMLPWISTDKVRTVYPDMAEEIDSLESAYKVVLDKCRERFVPGHRNILVAHAYIVDAQTSDSDLAAEVGKASAIGSDVFDGFDYVALGHLHGPQDITDTIRYSGSPMAYSFGKEETQVKSVTIIDTDDMSHKIVPIPQLHARTTITGTYDEIMKADYDREILDGYVRLEVTDSYIGMDTMALLRERYKNLIEVKDKGLERDDAAITMTIEEFENSGKDPASIFAQYCKDTLEAEPDEHLVKLFADAVRKYDKEVASV